LRHRPFEFIFVVDSNLADASADWSVLALPDCQGRYLPNLPQYEVQVLQR
jgi:hypothetical protein